jgi:hypothetical protein
MALTTVTLSGVLLQPDQETPHAGTLTFELAHALADPAGDRVIEGRRVVGLDPTGGFTVDLVATDDPDGFPTGVTYHVVERLGADMVREYDVELPGAVPEVDLADLVPALPGPPAVTYATAANLVAETVARTAAVEAHRLDTTDVHGIPDTALLADQAALAAETATRAAADGAEAVARQAHETATTAVHGIPDTAEDGPPAVPSLRTLGTGAGQALPGDTPVALADETPSIEELTSNGTIETTISATTSEALFIARFALTVEALSLVKWNTGDIAASDVDYWTVELSRYRGGVGTAVATKTTKVTGGQAITSRHSWSFDAVAFNAVTKAFQAGDVLAMVWTKTGVPANIGQRAYTLNYRPI